MFSNSKDGINGKLSRVGFDWVSYRDGKIDLIGNQSVYYRDGRIDCIGNQSVYYRDGRIEYIGNQNVYYRDGKIDRIGNCDVCYENEPDLTPTLAARTLNYTPTLYRPPSPKKLNVQPVHKKNSCNIL